MRVVGRNNVKYTSKKTNNLVEGINLHLVGTRPNVEGEAVETIFISIRSDMYNQCLSIPFGTEIRVSYNRWGSAEYIEAVPDNGKK